LARVPFRYREGRDKEPLEEAKGDIQDGPFRDGFSREPEPALHFVGRAANKIVCYPALSCHRAFGEGGLMIVTVDTLEDYEAGYLDTSETLKLFAELIRTGRAWNLGAHYLNEALYLIDAGYVTSGGKITGKGRVLMLDEGREGSPGDVNPEIVVGAFDDPIPACVAVPNA
jgi:hypothetical protein